MSGKVEQRIVVQEWTPEMIGTSYHARAAAAREHNDVVTALRSALADAARLREALRLHTVDNSGCDVCQGRWRVDQPEIHAPGCLAAPL